MSNDGFVKPEQKIKIGDEDGITVYFRNKHDLDGILDKFKHMFDDIEDEDKELYDLIYSSANGEELLINLFTSENLKDYAHSMLHGSDARYGGWYEIYMPKDKKVAFAGEGWPGYNQFYDVIMNKELHTLDIIFCSSEDKNIIEFLDENFNLVL